MNIEQIKALIDKIDNNWQSLDRNISRIYGEALDNAGVTCQENKEQVHNGDYYSDEFYFHFLGSLETILACSDSVTEEGRKFFEQEGVKY